MPRGQLSEKNTTMSFAIPKDLKNEIGIIAQKENRSMSNLIVSLLSDYANLYKQKERLTRYYKLISEIKDDTKSYRSYILLNTSFIPTAPFA